MIESLAEHFGGTQHGDERVEVFLMDKLLQLAGLPVGEGGVDHIMGLIGVGTKAGCVGSAAHQLAHDEITDGIFVVTDDEDGLSLIHISEPTRRTPISYAVFCLKKKK